MYRLYTTALAAAVTVYFPVALARRITDGIPLNLRERLGLGRHAPPPAPVGWLHAVSVGEAIAAAPLLDALRRAYPARPLFAPTVPEPGARLVRERFAGMATHRYFPLDFPRITRRVIESIQPAFFVGMETELWPNTLRALAERGVPTMIANGRLSDRSFRRYRMVRGSMRRVLADIAVFGMQSAEDARRMIALGAPPERVVVTGNLKAEPLPDPAGAVELWHRLLGLAADQPVWVAGSTHRGEEEAVLEAHCRALLDRPNLALVLAPRHPERVGEVLSVLKARGLAAVRRSDLPARRSPGAVIVLDTVGELAHLYAIADVVFVGGSLAPLGGHNMLEPALRGKPVLFGPHTHNFREAAAALVDSGGGRVVHDAAELAVALRRLLADPELRERVGAAGRDAVASRQGAVRATLDLIAQYLYPK